MITRFLLAFRQHEVGAYDVMVQRDSESWFESEELTELLARIVEYIIGASNSHRCKTIFRVTSE